MPDRWSILRVLGIFMVLVALQACGPVPDDDDDTAPPTGPGCEGAVLNEVQDGAADPIEIHNPGTSEINLGGCGVVDGNADHDPFLIATGTMLPAGGFLALRKEIDHDFGLGDADSVTLLDVGGEQLDVTTWSAGQAGVSWCRFPDGDGPWTTCARASMGAGNVLEYEATVVAPLFVAGLGDWDASGVRVREPNELAFDQSGRLWAGDKDGLRIQVFAPDGSFLQTVGDGDFAPNPGDDGRQGPEAIRVAPDGRVHAVDRQGDRVLVYDPTTFALVDTWGEDGNYVDLVGLEFTADRAFLADQGSDRIDAWEIGGDLLFGFDTEPGGQDLLRTLETLSVDVARGRLFATSEVNGRVEVFDLSDGEHTGGLCGPQSGGAPEPGRVADVVEGIFFEPVGEHLYVSDEQNQRILVFDGASPSLFDLDSDFGFLGSFGIGGSGLGELLSADGIAIAPDLDRLAIADQGNQRIQVFRLSDIQDALDL
jgi:DNA-binding beta-propeller fold protein YncE